jgi:hypothetical protein
LPAIAAFSYRPLAGRPYVYPYNDLKACAASPTEADTLAPAEGKDARFSAPATS